MRAINPANRSSTSLLLILASVVLSAVGCSAFNYEQAYERTLVDTIEVKTIPAVKLLAARSEGNYFDQDGALFKQLFSYIKTNDVSMTIPVEATVDPAEMVFFVGSDDMTKNLERDENIVVVERPEQLVVAIGGKGSYRRENYDDARLELEEWFAAQDRYVATGPPVAVYWNGPFVPAFMKKFEVYIPVEVR